MRSLYSRSVFGMVWIMASFGVFIVVKLVIFGTLFGEDRGSYYALYLSSGFFIWFVVNASIVSAAGTFISAQGFIKNDPLPLSVYVFKDVARELINLGFTALVLVAIFVYLRPSVEPVGFLSLAAVLVMILNMVWVKLFFGVVATRYRDVRHAVETVMRVMLFLTPIFWMPDQIGSAINVLWWNPLFHFLEIFRAPLIDASPALTSWIFVGVVTVVGWLLALVVFGRYRDRVVFWI
ncbi:MAG: ABC transporter permease [Pseudomonadota bacterium]